MLRTWLVILVVLSLAACSSAPPKSARSGGSTYGENAARTMPPGSPRFVDHSIGREEISIEAMSLIGTPYRWGGNTPDSGFDCSGLVRYVVGRASDIDLPRTTADISHRGQSVEPDEIAPGDLIFFNTTGRPHSHVGIYVGKLRFVNAPSTGGTVRLDYLTNPYWAKRFDGIRRVAPPLKAPSPFDAPTELAAPRAPVSPVSPVSPEPPPVPAMRTSAAVPATRAPVPISPTLPNTAVPNSAVPDTGVSTAAQPASPAPIAAAPAQPLAADAKDPIDAVADAFEPPPPAAIQAARQARQAGAATVQPSSTESNAPTMRASAAASGQGASISTNDDPIARFANKGD